MKQISTLLFAVLASYVHVSSATSDATFYGCYNSSGTLQAKATDEFQSRGACRGTCTASPGYSVQAMTNGTVCMCGNHLPNDQYKVDDTKCKQYCPGFKEETCGTRLGDYFSVYLTGLEDSPDQDPASTSSTEAPTPTPGGTQPMPTHPGPTTTTDPRASATASSTPKKSTNTAGVAAGVVVGILVLLGACAFAYILIRRRKRRQVEEEYKRSAAAREFAKHPIQDHRLDPVMAQRRDSAGSIADNQDFSRRILKVTNPDDR